MSHDERIVKVARLATSRATFREASLAAIAVGSLGPRRRFALYVLAADGRVLDARALDDLAGVERLARDLLGLEPAAFVPCSLAIDAPAPRALDPRALEAGLERAASAPPPARAAVVAPIVERGNRTRPLTARDVPAFVALRAAALVDTPLAFASSPGDDRFADADAVLAELRRAPESLILGAFDPELVGALGLYRDRHVKARHKVHLWGMYVRPEQRRRGLARELVQAALARARGLPGVSWAHLSVSSSAGPARALYESLGFRTWGSEPDALRWERRTTIEHHMALFLDPDGL